MKTIDCSVSLVLLALVTAPFLTAAEPAETQEKTPSAERPAAAAAVPDQQALFKRFEETMSNVKLVGRFTVLGKDDGPLPKEEYTIKGVRKLDEGDQWLFTARIKYGKNDVSVPLPLDVKWAGDTPVITLTNLTIPGLGTFSSRVVIDSGKYAGTWSHGEVGGHLFGTIEKIDAGTEETPRAKPAQE